MAGPAVIRETLNALTFTRFRNGISVGRLNGVINVRESDYREVQRFYDKCCRDVRANSDAAGRQQTVKQLDELLRDIEAVNAQFQDIRWR